MRMELKPVGSDGGLLLELAIPPENTSVSNAAAEAEAACFLVPELLLLLWKLPTQIEEQLKSCPRRLPCGLRGEAAAVGDGAVGPSETGKLVMLQELGRTSARAALMGSGTGTLAVSKRQTQSMLTPESELSVVQQLSFCEEPLLLLPVMTLKHGVKLLIIEAVQGERICPSTEQLLKIVAATEMNAKAFKIAIEMNREVQENLQSCHLSMGSLL